MLPYLKFIFFISTMICFGFVFLSQLGRVKSLLVLTPISISFGIASYIFTCHTLSFLIGPQLASKISIVILFLSSILILVLKYFVQKALHKPEMEANTSELAFLYLTATVICILSFLAIYRFGTFDKEFHIPLALTIFHNNIYPPHDFYKPDYVLLYHYGGDLFAGAISYFCNLEIFTSYELISSVLSGTTFLSLFALAWLITKDFKLSFLAGFCAYFGGGLLWLDACIKYFFKLLPPNYANWNFLQTFFNIGIHGGIIDAPSVMTFLSTSGLGTPLMILSLILFWHMYEETRLKEIFIYIVFITISLFGLFISAEWLYATFWAGVIPFLLFLISKKKLKFIASVFLLLIISATLSKSIGNPLFMQDPIQHLGRANIFDISLKQKLFTVMSWGRLSEQLMNYQEVSCFSWQFISEFGLSLILLPIAVIYLFKSKNMFVLLLFFIAAFTIPIPAIIEFKINPVDLNRLFNFGNIILIMLISCGIGFFYKNFMKNKILILIYLTCFCLSPLMGLFSSIVFTPYIYSDKIFVQEVFDNLKKIKSIEVLNAYFKQLSFAADKAKHSPANNFQNEIYFLKTHSSPGDVAISSSVDIPAYAGVYTIIPSGKWLYKDLLYSDFDSTFLTTLTTLDPLILDELNIRWILISNDSKNNLPIETQKLLLNNRLFNLVYVSRDKKYEIYHIENVKQFLNQFPRRTAWLLTNSKGQPVESAQLNSNVISLFPKSKDALAYLRSIQDSKPELKKVLITSQALTIDGLERQIKDSMLNITLDKKF